VVVVDLRGEEFEQTLHRLRRPREQRGGGRGEDNVRAGDSRAQRQPHVARGVFVDFFSIKSGVAHGVLWVESYRTL
jgi:hypothetical protein